MIVTCPKCNAESRETLNIPDHLVIKTIHCQECGTYFSLDPTGITMEITPRSWITQFAAWWLIAFGIILPLGFFMGMPAGHGGFDFLPFFIVVAILSVSPGSILSGLLLIPRNRITWWLAIIIMTINFSIFTVQFVYVIMLVYNTRYAWGWSDWSPQLIPTLFILAIPILLVVIDRVNSEKHYRKISQ